MSARRIGARWWVDFSFDGVRYRKRSPEDSRPGARTYEAVLRRRLAKGESLDGDGASGRTPTFGEAAEQWFSTVVTTNTKPSVQAEYRTTLVKHLCPRFQTRLLNSMATMDVEQFKAEQMARGLSPKTINNHLVVLSGLLTSAVEFGWIQSKPRIAWLKVPPQPFDFLSPEESARLLDANRGTRWHDMLLCALRTGMRVGELLGLQWRATNLDSGVLTVSGSIVRGVEGSPKNNRIRHIPVPTDLHDALRSRPRRGSYVFGLEDERPSTLPMATRGLLTACKRAGIRPIGWHVLRHSFASQLAALGAPIPAIQSLLGHATIQMTMRYAHLAPSTLATVVEMLSARRVAPASADTVSASVH